MTGYPTLFALIAPIFVLIATGVTVRRVGWLGAEADASLLKLVVNLFYPCLVFRTVLGSSAIGDMTNLAWAPVLGFGVVVAGFAIGFPAGRLAGLSKGMGLRTFVVSVGLFNWAYIPIALVTGLFPVGTLGVLFVFNVGVEFALWTVGIVLMAGGSMREGWRHLVNPVGHQPHPRGLAQSGRPRREHPHGCATHDRCPGRVRDPARPCPDWSDAFRAH